MAKLQAEEAAKRAAKQAEEEERRKQDREARLAAAAQYQEADWITASEAARAQEVGQGMWLDGRKVGGSAKACRATCRRGNDGQHSVQRAGTGLSSGIARRIWGLFDGAISVRCWLRLIARAAVRGQEMPAAVRLLRSLHLLCGQFQRPPTNPVCAMPASRTMRRARRRSRRASTVSPATRALRARSSCTTMSGQ